VYRPEADVEGEDLVVRMPSGVLVAVQQKARVHVESALYSNKEMWMLFPCSPFKEGSRRDWYLVEHDRLFEYMKSHHGHAKGFAAGKWSQATAPKHLKCFLEPYRLMPKSS
jgi:chlorite dismutase